MNLNHLLFFISISLVGLAEIRYKNLSGITVVFGGAVLLALSDASWLAITVSLAVLWGLVLSWPDVMMLPALFHPNAWPILLTGTGVRHGLVERGNLFVVGVLALVYPWQAMVISLVSLDLWRMWWSKKRRVQKVSAMPGILIGLGLFVAMSVFGIV